MSIVLSDLQERRCQKLRELMKERQLQNNPLACLVLGGQPRDALVHRLALRIGNWKGGYDVIPSKHLIPLARALSVQPVELYIEPKNANEHLLFKSQETDGGANVQKNGQLAPHAMARQESNISRIGRSEACTKLRNNA